MLFLSEKIKPKNKFENTKPLPNFRNIDNSSRFQGNSKVWTLYAYLSILLISDKSELVSPEAGTGFDSGLEIKYLAENQRVVLLPKPDD